MSFKMYSQFYSAGNIFKYIMRCERTEESYGYERVCKLQYEQIKTVCVAVGLVGLSILFVQTHYIVVFLSVLLDANKVIFQQMHVIKIHSLSLAGKLNNDIDDSSWTY